MKNIWPIVIILGVIWYGKMVQDDNQMHQDEMHKLATMNVQEFKKWQKERIAMEDEADSEPVHVEYGSQYDQ
jgi:hypothetical protein